MTRRRGSSLDLAWPELEDDPAATEASEAAEAKPERRRRLAFWDRAKFVLLLAGAWMALVWAAMANDPILPMRDALRLQVRSQWWLLGLLGIEILRQVHFFIAEHSGRYHQFWVRRFAGVERRTGRLNDWTRYRLARAFRWLVVIAIISVILGKATHVSPVLALFQIPARLIKALPFLLQVAVILLLIVGQFAAMFWFLSRGGMEVLMPDDIPTRFNDVWGQDAVLERVKENMLYLENPESVEERGGYVPGGILLWGPPGTGKTLMAEAVAGETGKPYVFVEPSAFINMFLGIGPLKVKSLFRKLRKLAMRYGGVVVFFDEADSLGSRGALATGGAGGWGFGSGLGVAEAAVGAPGPWDPVQPCNGLAYASEAMSHAVHASALQRTPAPASRGGLVSRFVMGGMGNGGGMGTLQVLLTELSGLKKARGLGNRIRRLLGMRPKPPAKYRILVMMATNMPQALDEALLRPGRIDRVYKVGYPSKEGRKRTYEGYLAKVQHELSDAQIDKLATITPYATGATIKDMVNEALILALRDEREAIEWQDIVKAKQLKEHGLPDSTEYIDRERHAVAVHEACHAVAAYRVRRHAVVDIATIERRGDVGGFVASIPPEDRFINWRSEYEADLVVSLASLAGERMFFDGDNSAGVGGDLRAATTLAMLMEAYWGMGSSIASHAVTLGTLRGMEAIETGSDRAIMETEFGRCVDARLRDQFDRTWRLLEANRLEVLAVAHALQVHRTISGDDVAAIIEGRPGPLVDGRPYHRPEFRDFIERYHASVLSAHARAVPVEVAMPVWETKPELALVAASPIEAPDFSAWHAPGAAFDSLAGDAVDAVPAPPSSGGRRRTRAAGAAGAAAGPAGAAGARGSPGDAAGAKRTPRARANGAAGKSQSTRGSTNRSANGSTGSANGSASAQGKAGSARNGNRRTTEG